MERNLKVFCVLFCLQFANAQNLEFKKTDSLIVDYINRKSLLIETAQKDNLKLLSLLPNIGYNLNSNSVNIGFNLSSYVSYIQQKKRNKIAFQELQEREKENLKKELEKLQKTINTLRESVLLQAVIVENFNITHQLFSLKKEQYLKNIIDLESYLNVQKNYLNNYTNIVAQLSQLELKTKVFAKKISCSEVTEQLYIVDLKNNFKSKFYHEQR